MPPKGTIPTEKKTKSTQDYSNISVQYNVDAFYGLDIGGDDIWNNLPGTAMPIARQRIPEMPPKTPTINELQESVESRNGIERFVYDHVADLGDAVLAGIKVVTNRLSFIPRLFNTLVFIAIRQVNGYFKKTFTEHEKQLKEERSMMRRELRGIAPYLKKANGDPKNWFKRLGIVMRKIGENHRHSFLKLVNAILPVTAAAALLLVINHWNNQTFALEVSYDQNVVGYIASESVFAEADSLARERIVSAELTGEGIKKPLYALVRVPINKISDSNTLSDRLVADSGENLTNAVGIYIDDEFICSVKNRSDAESVFDMLLAPYRSNKAGVFVDFVEDIRYQEGLFPDEKKTMWDAAQLSKKLGEKKRGEKMYVAKDGDNVWDIAVANGMSEEQLLNLNPKYKKSYLRPGDEIVISSSVNYVQVKVMKAESRTVSIPYETNYNDDPSLLRGTTRTLSKGEKGKQKITEMVTYLDGKRVDVKEIGRETTREPVAARVAKGTKAAVVRYANTGGSSGGGSSSAASSTPVKVATSGFVWPAVGCYTVSSPYGPRWGRFHRGVDLIRRGGNSGGSSVVAALDGTVEAAGYSGGGPGYRVIINHGGGLKTEYFHMQAGSVAVRVGQKVSAGTHIGRVGRTGNSTGNHLHFGVLVNGSYQNPMLYLR
ncbi:MAG: peptidoglycan DD-metalloendopeptidase family protein [Oscillospiraceae bacterium]|nr:peptidoglycan DD-metalloendopeptidase family protein [Oscillospiraceae bacterium]